MASGSDLRDGGRMALTSSDEERAEARKAEGATSTALRTPRPPSFTGRVACDHAELLGPRWTLVTLPRIPRKQSS